MAEAAELTISQRLQAAGFSHAADARALYDRHSVYGPCGEWLGRYAALDASAALRSGELHARLHEARMGAM